MTSFTNKSKCAQWEVLKQYLNFWCGSMTTETLYLLIGLGIFWEWLLHLNVWLVLFYLSSAACPVLCSGNGQYLKGRCMCHSGWKGSECDVPTSQCIDITCSGHGTCIVGTCICNPGYKGENCEEGACFQSYNWALPNKNSCNVTVAHIVY